MIAYQLSERKGYLECEDRGDRVLIGGSADDVFEGGD